MGTAQGGVQHSVKYGRRIVRAVTSNLYSLVELRKSGTKRINFLHLNVFIKDGVGLIPHVPCLSGTAATTIVDYTFLCTKYQKNLTSKLAS